MEQRIRKIIKEELELQDKPDTLEKSQPLSTLGLDSIIAIQIVVALEAEFDIIIDDEDYDMDNFFNMENICNLVRKYIEGNE